MAPMTQAGRGALPMAIQTQPEARSSIQSRLGAPRLEMRIAPGDARAYEIKAGEYVQIVDVEGKECSDFLAFNGSDHSDEMNLTLTRTNCEGLWPAPGQYVYADSGRALLRMEEDLVGRHDTTLPACNAAYYAAMATPTTRTAPTTSTASSRRSAWGRAPSGSRSIFSLTRAWPRISAPS